MIQLKLQKIIKTFNIDTVLNKVPENPFIFYLASNNTEVRFFPVFIIVDMKNQTMTYLIAYSHENVEIINSQAEKEIYSLLRGCHCTLETIKGEEFLTFMEDEEYFFRVNYKENMATVFTMNDFVKSDGVNMKKTSATFYKDEEDPKNFFVACVDDKEDIHLYRVSLTLDNFTEIDCFDSNLWPPHVIRKHNNLIFISNEFRFCKYILQKSNQILPFNDLWRLVEKCVNKAQLLTNYDHVVDMKESYENKILAVALSIMDEKYNVKCLPGNVMTYNCDTKERIFYPTSGGSPAHFEVDPEDNYLYTSSHNFIVSSDTSIFYEPAVIDKYKIEGSTLRHISSFQYEKGYRYTCHKIFKNNGKKYIATFGEPNRLIFIDADQMELVYYDDIGPDFLSNEENPTLFVNSRDRVKGYSYCAIETFDDGDTLFFLSPQHIEFYSFTQRKIIAKIDYSDIMAKDFVFDDYLVRTAHINYLT